MNTSDPLSTSAYWPRMDNLSIGRQCGGRQTDSGHGGSGSDADWSGSGNGGGSSVDWSGSGNGGSGSLDWSMDLSDSGSVSSSRSQVAISVSSSRSQVEISVSSSRSQVAISVSSSRIQVAISVSSSRSQVALCLVICNVKKMQMHGQIEYLDFKGFLGAEGPL